MFILKPAAFKHATNLIAVNLGPRYLVKLVREPTPEE